MTNPVLLKAEEDARKSEVEILAQQFHEQIHLRDGGVASKNTYKALKILATLEELVAILEKEMSLS